MQQASETSSDRDIAIHVSDSALMHLLLAGMESYTVRHWGKEVRKGPAETAGLLFGYVTPRDGMDHAMVEHVSTDTFAKGTYWSVDLNPNVTKRKCEVIADRWPYLSLVGDFHTHPYKTYSEASAGGWEASAGDRDWWSDGRLGVESHVALILTIARLTRKRSYVGPKLIGDNTIYWQQLDRYRFWLTAYAIDRDNSALLVSPDPEPDDRPTRPHVYLDVPAVNGTNAWFAYGEVPPT